MTSDNASRASRYSLALRISLGSSYVAWARMDNRIVRKAMSLKRGLFTTSDEMAVAGMTAQSVRIF